MPNQPASRVRKALSRARAAVHAEAPPSSDDLCAKIDALRYDMTQLQLCVQQIAEINAIENVLCRGFVEMREGLDLLRQSSSGRVRLRDDVSLRLDNLRTQLKGPSWSGATTLPILDQPVAFIGAAEVSSPDCGPAPPFPPAPPPYGPGEPDPGPTPSDYQPNRDQYGSAQS